MKVSIFSKMYKSVAKKVANKNTRKIIRETVRAAPQVANAALNANNSQPNNSNQNIKETTNQKITNIFNQNGMKTNNQSNNPNRTQSKIANQETNISKEEQRLSALRQQADQLKQEREEFQSTTQMPSLLMVILVAVAMILYDWLDFAADAGTGLLANFIETPINVFFQLWINKTLKGFNPKPLKILQWAEVIPIVDQLPLYTISAILLVPAFFLKKRQIKKSMGKLNSKEKSQNSKIKSEERKQKRKEFTFKLKNPTQHPMFMVILALIITLIALVGALILTPQGASLINSAREDVSFYLESGQLATQISQSTATVRNAPAKLWSSATAKWQDQVDIATGNKKFVDYKGKVDNSIDLGLTLDFSRSQDNQFISAPKDIAQYSAFGNLKGRSPDPTLCNYFDFSCSSPAETIIDLVCVTKQGELGIINQGQSQVPFSSLIGQTLPVNCDLTPTLGNKITANSNDFRNVVLRGTFNFTTTAYKEIDFVLDTAVELARRQNFREQKYTPTSTSGFIQVTFGDFPGHRILTSNHPDNFNGFIKLKVVEDVIIDKLGNIYIKTPPNLKVISCIPGGAPAGQDLYAIPSTSLERFQNLKEGDEVSINCWFQADTTVLDAASTWTHEAFAVLVHDYQVSVEDAKKFEFKPSEFLTIQSYTQTNLVCDDYCPAEAGCRCDLAQCPTGIIKKDTNCFGVNKPKETTS